MGDYHFIVRGHKIEKKLETSPPNPQKPWSWGQKMKDIVDYKNH
jgi:hypothetical protein